MPIMWISKVEAPEKVLPNVPFNLKANIWYITWPFKKITTFIKISNCDGKYEKCERTFRPILFFGLLKCIYKEETGIDNINTYKIETGYVK